MAGAGADPSEEEPRPADELPVSRFAPSTIGGVFYVAILVMTLVGLVVAATSDWRVGIRILSGVLAFAAALRLALPEKDAGMLAVRHRLLDVTILTAIAAALFLLAATIPDQPV